MDQKIEIIPGETENVEEEVWQLLEKVKDPEIPVVSVVEMGIVRAVDLREERVQVTITPTFSGCPALQAMQKDIKTTLTEAGFSEVEVRITHNPPWTSDWITPAARQKLKKFGLAPPPVHSGNFEILLMDTVDCPYCDSSNTSVKNTFGSTLCRAIHYCNDCQQAFEQFKPL